MISTLIAGSGALVALLRTGTYLAKSRKVRQRRSSDWQPAVSVIVPARNEENNIVSLLESLSAVKYGDLEVIVVDDQSTDRTYELASQYPIAKVIRGNTRPEGWCGKQWACQQGANAASGEVLIFTDADTIHAKNSVSRAIAFMSGTGADMISVAPKHSGHTAWEHLTGFFQVLLMFAANAFGAQRAGRAYCIGQYIAIKRAAYVRIGGHASVRDALVEDVPLANHALLSGIRYDVLTGESLYQVRMYATLADFIRGWRRNFRAGLKHSSIIATAEVTALIGALIFGGNLEPGVSELVCFGAVVVSLAFLVRRFTNYGPLVLLGLPVSILLFCLITTLSVVDSLLKKDVVWKGRAIAVR